MTVRAVVMEAPGRPLAMRTFEEPRAAGGAVLETVLSEVCGTDVHLHHGRLAGVPYPIIPGHVSCGRVLESDGLRDVEGRPIEAGRLVTFYDVYGVCGACWHCRRTPPAKWQIWPANTNWSWSTSGHRTTGPCSNARS